MKELDSILKNIKNKELQPVYFFNGDEPYYIDVAIKSFENDILSEDEKAFGQTVVYGRDTNYLEIISLAKQFPMFGDTNLIIVKEAQDLKLGEAEQNALEQYFENPVPTTLLVFAYKGKLDGKRKVTKLLSKNKMLYTSEKVKDWDLAKWIAQECDKFGIKTTPNIPNLLAEYLGNDLSRINNELSKLKIFLKSGDILDEKLVELHIGISKDFNVFELQKAVIQKDVEKALKIAYFMGKNPKSNPIVMTFGIFYTFFSNLIIYHTMKGQNPQNIASALRISPYFVKDYALAAQKYNLKHSTRIISILREMDLKSKGYGAVNMEDAEILKEMIYKITHIDQMKVKI